MIGLAVALAARRSQFPEEFDLLVKLASEVFITYRARFGWGVYAHHLPVRYEDWMVVSDRLAEAFGLRMVGKKREPNPKLGYARLPSNRGSAGFFDSKRGIYSEPVVGCARWEFDLDVIRTWGEV